MRHEYMSRPPTHPSARTKSFVEFIKQFTKRWRSTFNSSSQELQCYQCQETAVPPLSPHPTRELHPTLNRPQAVGRPCLSTRSTGTLGLDCTLRSIPRSPQLRPQVASLFPVPSIATLISIAFSAQLIFTSVRIRTTGIGPSIPSTRQSEGRPTLLAPNQSISRSLSI